MLFVTDALAINLNAAGPPTVLLARKYCSRNTAQETVVSARSAMSHGRVSIRASTALQVRTDNFHHSIEAHSTGTELYQSGCNL